MCLDMVDDPYVCMFVLVLCAHRAIIQIISRALRAHTCREIEKGYNGCTSLCVCVYVCMANGFYRNDEVEMEMEVTP